MILAEHGAGPFGLLPSPDVWGVSALAFWAGLCLVLVLRQRWTGLAAAMIGVGLLQWPMIAVSGTLVLRAAPDVAGIFLVVGAVATRRYRLLRRMPVLIMLGLLGWLCFEVLRVDVDPWTQLKVARQLLLPVLLGWSGWLLRDHLDWARLGRLVALAGMAAAAYMVAEKICGRPLIPVTPSFLASTHGEPVYVLRDGQPKSFFADGITAGPWLRPGGPFFNPPISGIFVATAAYAALRWVRGPLAAIAVTLCAAAAFLAVARAGILLIAAIVAGPLLLRRLGRVPTAVILLLGAGAAGLVLSGQGNSAAHGLALNEGVRFALDHVTGSGIGNQGYLALSGGAAPDAVSESWLGVVFASLGLAAVVVVAVLVILLLVGLWRAAPSEVLAVTFVLGALVVAALSESVGAMRGTTALWLFAGEALAVSVRAARRRSPIRRRGPRQRRQLDVVA